jgi:two-component system sensor histidine kinase RegB
VREVRKRFDDARAARLDIDVGAAGVLRVPWHGLAQVLASLVKNGFDASDSASGRVALTIDEAQGRARFTVSDAGSGIADAELAHVGEPFFTTKPPGAGMGLGVFLARTFAERLGGALTLSSELGKGTRAVLELPMREG